MLDSASDLVLRKAAWVKIHSNSRFENVLEVIRFLTPYIKPDVFRYVVMLAIGMICITFWQ